MEAAGLLSQCRFPGPTPTLAVSGGADSTAMLVLALAAGLDPTVVHIDHGLRPESSADAGAVVALCRRWDVAVTVVRVDLGAGPNLEARARDARYGAMPVDVCTGHTADDRVETLLLNLMRGSGLDGLAPMRTSGTGPHRPLLALRRADTASLCRALDLDVVEDSMNADPSFRRVRVRHELIPLLDSIAQRDVGGVLSRQIALFEDDADVLDELAAALDPTDARMLAKAPPALARRAVRRWLGDNGVTPGEVADQALVMRVLDVARGDAVGADLAGGWSVRRRLQRLRIIPPHRE